MTTHRTIQISNLLDTATSKARICRRGSDNLLRIGNSKGWAFQLARAIKFERLAEHCRTRLEKEEMRVSELRESQVVWSKLADEEETLAKFYEDNGKYGCTKSFYVRADLYRRVVKAIQIQIETGIGVCSCCFKPFNENLVIG